MLWDYIKENLKCSFKLWERHEALAVLIGAGLAALLALLMVYGLEIVFNFDAGTWLAVFVFGWFVFLVLVITPFRIYREQKTRVQELEEKLRSKLKISARSEDGITAEMIMVNIGGEKINDLEILLRNYRNANGDNIKTVIKGLKSREGKTNPMTLNAGSSIYVPFALVKKPSDQLARICLLTEKDGEIQVGQEVVVKLGIAGGAPYEIMPYVHLQIDQGGSLVLNEWQPPQE